jgi:repressor LexA
MNTVLKFPPTKKQQELLDFITSYMEQHKFAPSFQEMSEGTSIKSTSGVHNHLESLQERGWLARLRGRKRAIVLVF